MANDALGYPLNTPNDPATEGLWGTVLNTQTSGHATELLTRTNNYNFADYELQRPLLSDYAEEITSNATASGAVTLDYSASNHHNLTLTGNVTSLTISNPPASGRLGIMRIRIKQDATGGRTFAFPSSFKWAGGGSAPTVTSTASATDSLTIETTDGGTTWLASISQGFTGL